MLKKVVSAAVALFVCIFLFEEVQSVLITKSQLDGAGITTAYRYVEKGSVEVLFMGASQMFCAVDAGALTNEHGISSFDYGASSQQAFITKYYLRTALRLQDPKIVMLEVNSIFNKSLPVGDDVLAWNYAFMPASISKFESLYEATGGNIAASLEHTFAPVLVYHDRWKSFDENDVLYATNPKEYAAESLAHRGFLPRDHVESGLEIAYFSDDFERMEIPEYNAEAIRNMALECRSRGIRFVLFKVPVSNWTKGHSISVQEFADECGVEFLDLNAHWNEIGLDTNTDLYNYSHLNTSGAEKTTSWLAKWLKERL